MATITDFANNAAAVAAGYKRTQTDRGAGSSNPRFITVYDKPVTGANASGFLLEAVGVDNTAQATADTNALNALNAQRKHYYGGSPGRADANNQSDNSRAGVHTVDAT